MPGLSHNKPWPHGVAGSAFCAVAPAWAVAAGLSCWTELRVLAMPWVLNTGRSLGLWMQPRVLACASATATVRTADLMPALKFLHCLMTSYFLLFRFVYLFEKLQRRERDLPPAVLLAEWLHGCQPGMSPGVLLAGGAQALGSACVVFPGAAAGAAAGRWARSGATRTHSPAGCGVVVVRWWLRCCITVPTPTLIPSWEC